MSITFNEEALKPIVSAVIMEKLGDDQRNQLIEQAVQHLITPARNSYGRAENTPLQEAFNLGVSTVAHQIVRELFKERPEFAAKIRESLTGALEKLMDDNYDLREVVINALATAIREMDEKARYH